MVPEMTGDALRILAVDDEESITDLLGMALRYEGFDVQVSHTGRQALRAVTDRRPHLLILDVMLPDLDGFEIAKRLASRGDKVPILFLTARDTTEDKVRGLTLGGDGNVVETYISYLRRKLDGLGPPLIHTVRGVGYSLRAPED